MIPQRCAWCVKDALYTRYHDEEWGVPVHDDRMLFEFLVLEGMQAGLSWLTILKKRDNFRAAFSGFDPARVARYDRRQVRALLGDAGIIRNRLKIESAITNARAFLAVQERLGSFDKYIWQFTDGRTQHNRWRVLKQVPCRTREADAMSKDLIARGFRFVGSTICYAHMQATGMVNDHITGCFRHGELSASGAPPQRVTRRGGPPRPPAGRGLPLLAVAVPYRAELTTVAHVRGRTWGCAAAGPVEARGTTC